MAGSGHNQQDDLLGLQATPLNRLPVLPEAVRNPDTLQWFYDAILSRFTCQEGGESPLYLRRGERGLVIRVNNQWREYGRGQNVNFWRDAMRAYPDLAKSNWSTKRQQALWDYFNIYAPEIDFDNRRYFEMRNCILDGYTGELNTDEDRFLKLPTTRSSSLPYDPEYAPSPAWRMWYEGMDDNQRQVRDWSVGSAFLGNHGLLFTFGQSRTGKSTLAEGLSEVLGSGAYAFSLSSAWTPYTTGKFENTTYLYDPDAKGSKNQNNTSYERLHLMASGDPIQMEVKHGDLWTSSNYGFMEVISNAPATMKFEQSMVDRVRFCLYTYIKPRGDDGRTKRLILADKQAWLNYAVGCAIKLAKGETTRPPLGKYQIYGWVKWLQEANSYGKMCVDAGWAVTYDYYVRSYNGKAAYMLTRETVDEMRAGFKELESQYGGDFLSEDWAEYERELGKGYYNEEAPKLF